MLESQKNLIRLSQGQLNLLETCPPKFQQIYLNKLSSLPNPETEEKQTWGSQFHLLMQQRELGLPIETLLAKNQELDQSLQALLQAAPHILDQSNNQWREAEHSRTLNFGNYLLTVIYDLLVADDNQAQIIDWKTYLKPQRKDKLAQNWQTRQKTAEDLHNLLINLDIWIEESIDFPHHVNCEYKCPHYQELLVQEDSSPIYLAID